MNPQATMKIWQAFTPTVSDDSRVGDNFVGFFSGEKDDVLDWLHVKGWHTAYLREVEARPVTREKIERLKETMADLAVAKAAFEAAS